MTEVGEDHDAHAVQPLVRDDLPGGAEAVKHRHLNVHKRDVRAVLSGQRHRLPPVGIRQGHDGWFIGGELTLHGVKLPR